MLLPVKKTALASLLAISAVLSFSAPASAATNLGNVTTLGIFGTTPALGAFDDLYNFTVSPNSGAIVSGTAFTFLAGGTTMSAMQLYAGTFASATDLIGQVALPTTIILSQSAGTMFTAFTKLADYAALNAVGYTLRVTGSSSIYAMPYTGFIALAPVVPVPEPETYAMVLAGLGMMAVMARRRKMH